MNSSVPLKEFNHGRGRHAYHLFPAEIFALDYIFPSEEEEKIYVLVSTYITFHSF